MGWCLNVWPQKLRSVCWFEFCGFSPIWFCLSELISIQVTFLQLCLRYVLLPCTLESVHIFSQVNMVRRINIFKFSFHQYCPFTERRCLISWSLAVPNSVCIFQWTMLYMQVCILSYTEYIITGFNNHTCPIYFLYFSGRSILLHS